MIDGMANANQTATMAMAMAKRVPNFVATGKLIATAVGVVFACYYELQAVVEAFLHFEGAQVGFDLLAIEEEGQMGVGQETYFLCEGIDSCFLLLYQSY